VTAVANDNRSTIITAAARAQTAIALASPHSKRTPASCREKTVAVLSLTGSGCLGHWLSTAATGFVGPLGGEHGPDDVAARPGQADERGVVLFSFGSLPVVERLGLRRPRRGERREEHGALEPMVASAALLFAVDALAGLAGDRGEAGVGGERVAVREPGAVADLGQDA
jgi:hypothetical protein